MNVERWWKEGTLVRLQIDGADRPLDTPLPKIVIQKRKTEPQPWPMLLLPMKLLAKESDRGAGDIIARTIGPIGGDAFKKWYKTLFGKDCGCGNRQETLNARWPL